MKKLTIIDSEVKVEFRVSKVSELVTNMRAELLPKKAATVIQNNLQKHSQNEMSISGYGKEQTELFVNLAISQANGNAISYRILKPYVTKQFADVLRNHRLSTIISARN